MEKLSRTKTASLDVDPQNGFTPICPDELPVEGGDEIAIELNQNQLYAHTSAVSKDAHSRNANWVATKENPQFSPIKGNNVDIRWNSHCNVGEEGFELIPGIVVQDYDFIVYKGLEKDMHPYGACYHDFKETTSTGLIEFFRSRGVENVVVGGLALDYCVKTSVIQLLNAGFTVLVNLASTKSIAPFDEVVESYKEMKEYNKTMFLVNEANELLKYFV